MCKVATNTADSVMDETFAESKTHHEHYCFPVLRTSHWPTYIVVVRSEEGVTGKGNADTRLQHAQSETVSVRSTCPILGLRRRSSGLDPVSVIDHLRAPGPIMSFGTEARGAGRISGGRDARKHYAVMQ